MEESLVQLHVLVRWLILGSALVAVVAIVLARRHQGWDRASHFWAQAYAGLMGAQSVIGVVLWFAAERWRGQDAFLSFVHPSVMLVAVGLAHGGLALAYRQEDLRRTNRLALLSVAATFAIVLVTIPWFAA
jgi:type II secretory pathway component PulK